MPDLPSPDPPADPPSDSGESSGGGGAPTPRSLPASGSADAAELVGTRIGHYRVDGVIGRGGMSTLYRATDVRLGRVVALKVIVPVLAADQEFRDRFVEEARNTSAVDHAHVVPIYDFDEVDGHLYIAMRLVEGTDLDRLLRAHRLSPARTLTLLSQVASALDAVHARGLVHLDVKPANVLVTNRETAGREHAYLGDFGLTRRGATGHRTAAGDFLGSPTYAAPEHLRGEPVDARTDVYALTCVLFTCLTGRAPYRGSVTEVIEGHLSGQVPSVTSAGGGETGVESATSPTSPTSPLDGGIGSRFDADTEARLDAVIRRGMDPDPPRRPDSAGAVIDAARTALWGPGGPGLGGPGRVALGPVALGPAGPGLAGPGSVGPGGPAGSAGPFGGSPGPGAHPGRTTGAPGAPTAMPVPAGRGPRGSSATPPVRLRDPLPPEDGRFVPARSLIVPLVTAGVVLLVLAVVVVVALT